MIFPLLFSRKSNQPQNGLMYLLVKSCLAQKLFKRKAGNYQILGYTFYPVFIDLEIGIFDNFFLKN